VNGAQPAAAAAASVHQADSISSVHLLCQRTPDEAQPSETSWCGASAEMQDSSSPTAMVTVAICSIGKRKETNKPQDKVSVLTSLQCNCVLCKNGSLVERLVLHKSGKFCRPLHG
jgi:hypothetical protein